MLVTSHYSRVTGHIAFITKPPDHTDEHRFHRIETGRPDNLVGASRLLIGPSHRTEKPQITQIDADPSQMRVAEEWRRGHLTGVAAVVRPG